MTQLLKYIFILLILNSYQSIACTCVRGATIQSSFYQANIVIKATILESIEIIDTIEYIHKDKIIVRPTGYICKAQIIQKYKGSIKTDTISISTGYGGGDCGVIFENGKNYIIYTRSQGNGYYYTNVCYGTKRYSKKEHKLLLKLSRKQNQ